MRINSLPYNFNFGSDNKSFEMLVPILTGSGHCPNGCHSASPLLYDEDSN